ncbi:flagellar filament core protein flaB2 domain protein [Leptospira meyeri]|uniref:flagellar filament core protein flaB2 domain protein n=1 Tax=Leptospira meyeri TaxID=29508 RepID=UPI000C2A5B68|nr:flagellar filament core protein flaB2 domain protein [Leptospira meyeri]PKA26356.1 flagellar filament core protein flaB2 domain protein [Leptospira sp. mixed culture ATI2-C-A1]MCW7487719.1 flagellar filament core protein flaB2 domain protein [Leptospira meyeri]PJZ79928.1 flagellar filament core protein flaB2 domain protein [Leptospira meyeri]PJZ96114.1 flagellar filament core protein flaB2 domain protein [Leptospira meyeri]PKA14006.1 flagellar filament core protein flaB2 domain protein [Lep
MKLSKNPIWSTDSQRETIIQKQIHTLRKEIVDWVSMDPSLIEDKKDIIIRTNTSENFFDHSVLNRTDVSAIDSRLKFISLSSERLEKLYELQPTRTTFQKQTFLIRKAIVYLDTMLLIAQRMSSIAKSKTFGERKDLQLEVTTLIDEVDRIASFAEYNNIRLFKGHFARNSRVASMWFINETNGELFRVYLATMTAKSLGLTSSDGNPATLSSPVLFQKKMDEAINKIIEERKRMQSVLN